MDERIIAITLDVAMSADRMGIPYGEKYANLAPFQPAGVHSWKDWVEYIAGYVKRMQDATCARWCGQNDPLGKPIVYGNIRYGINGGWTSVSQYVQPYPILFFEDAMLADALLRAWRQYGCTACRDRAIEMTAGVKEHFDPAQHALPYRSHGSNMWNSVHDLDNFWVRPLLGDVPADRRSVDA